MKVRERSQNILQKTIYNMQNKEQQQKNNALDEEEDYYDDVFFMDETTINNFMNYNKSILNLKVINLSKCQKIS